MGRNQYLERPDFPAFFNKRDPDTHKGHYGHAFLAAGSLGKVGAARFSAEATLRMGAGLLTVHVPRCAVDILQTVLPEAMLSPDNHFNHIRRHFEPSELALYNAIGVGPGIGTHADTIAFLGNLIEMTSQPMVLDADALNCLAVADNKYEMLGQLYSRAVITPHAREYERIFGSADSEEQRLEQQRRLSNDLGIVIVYKGHNTIVTGKNDYIYLNDTGNAGMATAGSGDVLTGIILGIMAQNADNQLTLEECASLGVWIHGKSGDIAASHQPQCTILARDLIKNLCNIEF